MPLARPYAVVALISLAAAAQFSTQASAQQVYRIVGPDGRVTFSDKPPTESNAKLAPIAGPSGGSANAGLPYGLQQVASRFPVTLYTSGNCNGCGSGRAHLASRGIPFTEKTITTREDGEALQRMAGDTVVPLLTVGGQQIKGYSDSEWSQFLDAAGYPAKSLLPATWRNPEPSPLVTVQRPAPTATAGAERRNTSPAPAPAPVETGDNPAGIKF